MLVGEALRSKIRTMRLSENEFARLCGFTYTTLSNLLANKTKVPKPEVVAAVERVAAQCCPTCRQYAPHLKQEDVTDGNSKKERA